MYKKDYLTTGRMKNAYYRAGEEGRPRLLLVHGNVSSSEFYLPLFPLLEKEYEVVALDLRCFGDSDALPVDALRGYRDWTEDIRAFAEGLGWESFAMAGWSMGGGIAMQYAIDYAQQLTGLILINPASPFGFGGTKGETGELLEPRELASGGGCANAQLIQAIRENNREFMRTTLNQLYFKPPFRMQEEWEERLIDSMLKTKTGEGMYPGDSRQVKEWPFVAAGARGILNTLSPVNGNLSALAEIGLKPPILWVRGEGDAIVSDTSLCDFGFLGQCGMAPGWPGADVVPPQPMVAQTRYLLDKYAGQGGSYQEVVFPAGHGVHLEQPEGFVSALRGLLKG